MKINTFFRGTTDRVFTLTYSRAVLFFMFWKKSVLEKEHQPKILRTFLLDILFVS